LAAGAGPALAPAAGGALALAAALVVLARPVATRAPRTRRGGAGDLARSGADLLLVALAVAAVLQLRGRTVATGAEPGRVDPVLVAAPLLCLLAGVALVLRVLPPLLRQGERLGARARGLVVPLVAWDLARRPTATAAVLLTVLGAGTATWSAATGATWAGAARDAATLAVGADVVVDPGTLAPGSQPPVVAAVLGAPDAGAARALPVVRGPVALGRWSGPGGEVPELLAVDVRAAGGLVRGRAPDGRGWRTVLGPLVPRPAATRDGTGGTDGVTLGPGGVVLTGTGSGAGLPLLARATLVVGTPSGLRVERTGAPVALDGAPTTLPLPVLGGPEAARLVAVRLELGLDPEVLGRVAADGAVDVPAGSTGVSVRLALPGAAPGTGAAAWSVLDPVTGAGPPPGAATLADGALDVTTRVEPSTLVGGSATLLLTPAPAPTEVPVLVTADVADGAGLAPGRPVGLVVDGTAVPGRVAGVVPWLPGRATGPGVLADLPTLARVLAARGAPAASPTAWWGVATDGAAAG
ncbi:hypothetical protein, partial [Cellulomonas endophytica]|uniref:hypothetical protein n=1 Tax=Cellulomonas endophytica TaxID=2494735 RepID=UPI003B84A6E8